MTTDERIETLPATLHAMLRAFPAAGRSAQLDLRLGFVADLLR